MTTALTAGNEGVLAGAIQRYRGRIVDAVSGKVTAAADLRRDIADIAAALAPYEGRTVLLKLSNGAGFVASVLGAIGAKTNPLLLSVGATVAETALLAERVGAAALLEGQDKEGEEGNSALPHGLSLTDYPHPLERDWARRAELRGVPLHLTSGTSAGSKIVVRLPETALAEAENYIEELGLMPDHPVLCPVPMSHAFGFGAGMMTTLLTSATLVTFPQFAPRALARYAQENCAGVLLAVPPMLDPIGRFISGPAVLRYVITAGSPLTSPVADRFAERTGIAPRSLYGTTETGGISAALWPARGASAGSIMRRVKARAVAKNGDAPTLRISSPSMMAGYLDADGIDGACLQDGWFDTKDYARIEGGKLHLLGRSGDVINVRGKKVLASEVEETVMTLPAVASVKVYAGIDRAGAECVAAALVTKSPLGEEEVRRHCLDTLSPEKCPQIVTFHDELPSSPSGKILLRELPHAKLTQAA